MPWYTTADARRDAEKQAAIKKREDTMSYTFEVGKSGTVKAIHELGAVELVPHWTWQAAAIRQLIAERDQLRARLAAIHSAKTVAIAVHTFTDRGPYKWLNFAEHDIPASGVELIARPTKD